MSNDIHVKLSASKISYLPGEEFCLQILFDVLPVVLTEEICVWVAFHKIEDGRVNFKQAIGEKPSLLGNHLIVKRDLPPEFSLGLYQISDVTLCLIENDIPIQHRLAYPPFFFAVQSSQDDPLTEVELVQMVAQAEEKRLSYMNREIHTEKSRQTEIERKKFMVLVFGEGCLLHCPQQLEGYIILPLGLGLSHRRLNEIVNITLSCLNLDTLEFDQELENKFENDTPTFLVLYQAIVAIDHDDAMDYCRSHANIVFELMSLDRGQKPHDFACLVYDLSSSQRWIKYKWPYYKGFLNPDFDPSSTANLIDRHATKLQNNPFLQLLIKTYADATAENNRGFALLRFWSVLELLADKYVQKGIELKNPDGTSLPNKKGKSETTCSKVGRVFHYVSSLFKGSTQLYNGDYLTEGECKKPYLVGPFSSHLYPEFTQLPDQFSHWDMIKAGYAVRNAIAHEGQFTLTRIPKNDPYYRLATELIKNDARDPYRFIRHIAELGLRQELNKT